MKKIKIDDKLRLATNVCILCCPLSVGKFKKRMHTKQCDETWTGLGLDLNNRSDNPKPIK